MIRTHLVTLPFTFYKIIYGLCLHKFKSHYKLPKVIYQGHSTISLMYSRLSSLLSRGPKGQLQNVLHMYSNMSFQVFKRGIHNQINVWPKINILKGNYCILLVDIILTCQKVQKSDFQSQIYLVKKYLWIHSSIFFIFDVDIF